MMEEDRKLRSELDALRKLYALLKDGWIHSKNAVSSDCYLDENALCFLKNLLDDAAKRVFEGHLKFIASQFVSQPGKTEESPVLVPSISFNNYLKMSAKASESISMKAEEDKQTHNSELKSHNGSLLRPQTSGKRRHCKVCQQTNDAKHVNSGRTVSSHLHQIKGQEEGVEFSTSNCRDAKEVHKSAANDDQKEIHKSTAKQFDNIFGDDGHPRTVPLEIDDFIRRIELHSSVLHSAVGRQIDPLEEYSASNFLQHGNSDRSRFNKPSIHQVSSKKTRRNLDWQRPQASSQSSQYESIETKKSSTTDYSSFSTTSDGSDQYQSQNVETSSDDRYSKQSSDSEEYPYQNGEAASSSDGYISREGSTTSSRSVSSTKNDKTSNYKVPKVKQKGRFRSLKEKLGNIFHHHHHHYHHHHGDVVSNNSKVTKVRADDKKHGKSAALKAPNKNWKGNLQGLLKRHRNLKRSKKPPKADIKMPEMKGGDGKLAKKLHWWEMLNRQKGGGPKLPSKPHIKFGYGKKKRRPKALPPIT